MVVLIAQIVADELALAAQPFELALFNRPRGPGNKAYVEASGRAYQRQVLHFARARGGDRPQRCMASFDLDLHNGPPAVGALFGPDGNLVCWGALVPTGHGGGTECWLPSVTRISPGTCGDRFPVAAHDIGTNV